MWNFIPENATFWCILLASVVIIICGHWSIGGMITCPPFKYTVYVLQLCTLVRAVLTSEPAHVGLGFMYVFHVLLDCSMFIVELRILTINSAINR